MTLADISKNMAQTLLGKTLGQCVDLLLPPTCPMTGEHVEKRGMIHASYWINLRFIGRNICYKCGLPMPSYFELQDASDQHKQNEHLCGQCLSVAPHYDAHRSCVIYDDHSKPLILRFKHSDQHHLARTFCPWLVNSVEHFSPISGMDEDTSQDETETDFDLILPVPLHYWRLLKRRYNQSALLSQLISSELGIPWSSAILKRTKHTAPQGLKSTKDRQKNVANVFAVTPKYLNDIKDKHILLIDDVYTTGATVNSCANTLKEAGAATVRVLTVMRTTRD